MQQVFSQNFQWAGMSRNVMDVTATLAHNHSEIPVEGRPFFRSNNHHEGSNS